MVHGTVASALPGNLKMQITDAHPIPTESEIWGWSPAVHALTNNPSMQS